jgi:hypothetical protein
MMPPEYPTRRVLIAVTIPDELADEEALAYADAHAERIADALADHAGGPDANMPAYAVSTAASCSWHGPSCDGDHA